MSETLDKNCEINIIFLTMFSGPYIVIYQCNKNQQDALFSFKFISIVDLYMFRAVPSRSR
jgi:hypothetical protein